VWTLPAGQMEVSYKTVRVPPRDDVRVEYTIHMLDSEIQREDSGATIPKETLRQGLVNTQL